MNVSFKGVILHIGDKRKDSAETLLASKKTENSMLKAGFIRGKNLDSFFSDKTRATYVVTGDDYSALIQKEQRDKEKPMATSKRIFEKVYISNPPLINWLNNRVTQVVDVSKQ